MFATAQQIHPSDSPPLVPQEDLAFLRVIAARSRCAARTDLFEACALLSMETSRAAETLALALFRAFSGQGGMPRLRIYQPAAVEISFDERWLLAALAAAKRGDRDSLTFLLARRIPRHAQRNIGFLVSALADAQEAT
ncbi:hypothetical protein V8J82_12805 [Gymnodinialimonas sp. 2305UL16-5]|uniref:hypothetical protein n=1 Tax=Gymnodinialimonas mytili TaxID=3126503 RepID=UPI00309A986F